MFHKLEKKSFEGFKPADLKKNMHWYVIFVNVIAIKLLYYLTFLVVISWFSNKIASFLNHGYLNFFFALFSMFSKDSFISFVHWLFTSLSLLISSELSNFRISSLNTVSTKCAKFLMTSAMLRLCQIQFKTTWQNWLSDCVWWSNFVDYPRCIWNHHVS